MTEQLREYETREVTHGVSWGAFAPIAKGLDGKLDSTVTPKVFTGLTDVKFDIKQDSTAFYADNVTHVTLRGNKVVTGTLTAYQITRDFLKNHLGYKEAATGGLLDTGPMANFIWQYIETVTDEFGVEFEQLSIYYNVSSSFPTGESKTDEDKPTPKEYSMDLTASPNTLVLDEDGIAVTVHMIRKTEDNAGLFDLAYKQIIMPDTPIPPKVPTA